MTAAPRRPDPDKPLLGLAMIVRDGGQFLASLLQAARSHVDEIVVVDTGSRDDSRRIAAENGARGLEFPWCDDFAAARNASLDACASRWVLCLDADEQLCPADWRHLRETAAAWHATGLRAGRVLTRNYVREPWSRRDWEPVPALDPHALADAAAGVAPGFVPSRKVRLFANDPAVRFEGRLHETVEASLVARGVEICDLPVVVHHFGLLEADPGKPARYLALARRKVEDRPDDPTAWSELADCAVAAGDRATALAACERALALRPAAATDRLTAGWLLLEAGDLARADAQLLAVAGCAGASDRQVGEACHLRAQVAIRDGRSEAAGSLLAAALRLLPGDGHVFNTLGTWHLTGGRAEPARAALERAAQLLPHRAEPCLNLARLYEAAGHPDLAARQYARARDRDPSRAAGAAAARRLAARC